MTPTDFPERTTFFHAPRDFTETQVLTIPAFTGNVDGGSCDGCPQVVVCWELSADDLATLIQTRKLFISMLGGLAPHFPSTDFHAATHPA